VPQLIARLVIDYFAYVARLGASARCTTRRRLLHQCHASEFLGTSRGSSHGSSRRSSSTTSPTPHVRVPRHVARLLTRLVAPLVVDYLDYAVRPGASAPRVALRAARHAARYRLLRLRRATGCLSMSRGSSRGSSSTTSTMPRVRVPRHIARLVTRLVALFVVDYFAYTARLGASARRAACRVAHRRLLRLRRASGCLDTSRGSLRGSSHRSSSTASPTPRPGASACRAARHVARR
jgi:hypothetical protein